jgi:hypothetical protein
MEHADRSLPDPPPIQLPDPAPIQWSGRNLLRFAAAHLGVQSSPSMRRWNHDGDQPIIRTSLVHEALLAPRGLLSPVGYGLRFGGQCRFLRDTFIRDPYQPFGFFSGNPDL